MKTFRTTLLLIIFTLPFLFADLYTKYLAHTELPNEGDQVVLIKHLNAISPMINYGSIFGGELKNENASHFTHLLFTGSGICSENSQSESESSPRVSGPQSNPENPSTRLSGSKHQNNYCTQTRVYLYSSSILMSYI